VLKSRHARGTPQSVSQHTTGSFWSLMAIITWWQNKTSWLNRTKNVILLESAAYSPIQDKQVLTTTKTQHRLHINININSFPTK
jgi:hypothetical protein